MLKLCRVDAYAKGRNFSSPMTRPKWSMSASASLCSTAHEMWANLEAVHALHGHQMIILYMCNLLHTTAEELGRRREYQ